MILMAYNILMGGNLEAGDRTDLLLDVIKSVNPTILGLCECKGFEENHGERFDFFCRQLGMEGVMNRAAEGNHVALLYRKGIAPVRASTTDVGMQHGAVRIVFNSQELGPLAIVLTHLHAYSSWYRVTEAQTVVAKALTESEAIIMGDMNAIAAADLPLDLAAAPRAMVARLSAPDNTIDTLVVDTILNQGFEDVGGASLGPTYSTTVGKEGKDSGPLVRLDHIFATPGLAALCRSVSVVRDDPALRASDHLPIVAEFDLTLEGTPD